MSKYHWFTNAKYGLVPSGTVGWAMTLAFLIAIVINFWLIDSVSHSASDTIINFYPYVLFYSAIYLILAYLTSPKHWWMVTKSYGWGWVPSTWQGWYILLLYIGGVLETLSISLVLTRLDPLASSWFVISGLFLQTVVFFMVSLATGEKPRWRWGKKRK